MIEVGESSIVIRNIDLTSETYKKINAYFSVYDKIQHKYVMSSYIKINNDLYFPASIGTSIIKYYFPNENIVYNYKSSAKADNINFSMKHNPKNEIQTKSINFLLTMKKDETNKMRFLSLATGTGKTYVTINVISKLKKKAIIVVDTLALAAQWKDQFLKHTSLDANDIRILSGYDSIEKEIKDNTGLIYIAMHRTLGNMLDQDNNSVNDLMNKLGIGIRVFDESHVEFKNICQINSLSNVNYTIFLSATPSRSQFNDNTLYGRVFKNIPFYNGKDISNVKYHTVIIYKMNTKPPIETVYSVKTKYGFNSSRWASYISGNGYDEYCKTLDRIFSKFSLDKTKKKIAILLPTIELIKLTKDYLSEKYPTKIIGTFIGEVKEKIRPLELQKEIILTNDKIFDKAIDVPDLEILINFVPLASLVKTEQIIGRLRDGKDKASILIDVCDVGFPECIEQLKKRKRFYKKKAKSIFEIEN